MDGHVCAALAYSASCVIPAAQEDAEPEVSVQLARWLGRDTDSVPTPTQAHPSTTLTSSSLVGSREILCFAVPLPS